MLGYFSLPYAYHYLVQNYPDLWIIETNSSYRGWFVDDES